MTANPGNPLEPILLGPDAGEARWWGDSLAIIKAASETTGGQIAVVDNYAAEGAAAPLHIHHNEGEAFYVVHGALTIWVGGKSINAIAGSFVWTAGCTAYLHGDLSDCPVPVHHASSRLRSVRAGGFRSRR
jgi:quercetin dioxygenase-like cupin family protein